MTQKRRLVEDDKCHLRWCQEAGAHAVHRQYLTSFLTDEGRAVGVNVVQSGDRPRAVELTMLPRHGMGQTVIFQLTDAEAVAKGMRAGIRLARPR